MLLAQTFGDTDNVEQERSRGRTNSIDGSLSRNSNDGRPRPWFALPNVFFHIRDTSPSQLTWQIYYANNAGALHLHVPV
jgi:hypothetical protein